MSAENIVTISSSPTDPGHISAEDLTLFAMQFLDVAQAGVVSDHIERCATCRGELLAIQGDLAVYALATDQHAPAPAARQRLLQQIGREKKFVRTGTEAPPIAAFGRSGSTLEFAQSKPRVGQTILGWSGWAVAAGLAVTAGLLYQDRDALRSTLGAQSGQLARLTADAAEAHKLMDALTDPAAVRVSLTTKPAPPAPLGRATYNPQKGSLIFLASKLDPLQMYKTYELWIIPADGSAPVPAGTFHPDDQGNASVIMPEIPKGVAAKAFGVTIEDEGGSKTPTAPIIMAGS